MAGETDDFPLDDYTEYLSKDLGIDQEQLETLGFAPPSQPMFQPVERADGGFDYGTDNQGQEGRRTGMSGVSDSGIEQPGIIKSALSGASSWIKDNKELATMIGSGIAGAVRDKNAREMSQAQIDYLKQRQAELNGSIHAYGQDIRKKA